MTGFARYAIYHLPDPGPLAAFGAGWQYAFTTHCYQGYCDSYAGLELSDATGFLLFDSLLYLLLSQCDRDLTKAWWHQRSRPCATS